VRLATPCQAEYRSLNESFCRRREVFPLTRRGPSNRWGFEERFEQAYCTARLICFTPALPAP